MDFKIKNFTMELFNNDVNGSGSLQAKYKEWADYRKKITKFMTKSIESKDKKNIIVLGAGECNDIDLHFLINTFDEVTLSDVDIKSIDDGMARQKLRPEEIKKIRKVQQDYTGLSKSRFF